MSSGQVTMTLRMERSTVGISESDLQLVREFLVRRTGLNFTESKRDDLLTVVQDRVALYPGYRGMKAYVELMERGDDGGRELRALVTRLTVGETYFFRNRAQFAVLRDELLPALIARRRRESPRLRIWSAGCSTGEEPYSIAILLLELLPDIAGWDIHLLATDINEDALAAAREGLYRNWSFREVEEHYRARYFRPESESHRILPAVKSLVTFRYLNLADGLFPTAATGTDDLDLIVCRNVMIYFTPKLCIEITHQFFRCLADRGVLLVGHSEHSDLIYPGFSRRFHDHAVIYEKSGPNPVWEKGLAIRFRGSGPLPPGFLTHAPRSKGRAGVQRPENTEETVLFERAALLSQEMRTAEAVQAFQRVLALNPANERAIYAIAMLLANSGDAAGAVEWGERLLAVNPLHLEATYLLAIVARELGEEGRELALLKRSLYLNPDFVLGHFQAGLYHLKRGKRRQAERSLRNVLRLLGRTDGGVRVEGVDGMTVGRLRETVLGLLPEAGVEDPS